MSNVDRTTSVMSLFTWLSKKRSRSIPDRLSDAGLFATERPALGLPISIALFAEGEEIFLQAGRRK